MQVKSLKKINLPDKPGVYFFLGPSKRSEGGKKGKTILLSFLKGEACVSVCRNGGATPN